MEFSNHRCQVADICLFCLCTGLAGRIGVVWEGRWQHCGKFGGLSCNYGIWWESMGSSGGLSEKQQGIRNEVGPVRCGECYCHPSYHVLEHPYCSFCLSIGTRVAHCYPQMPYSILSEQLVEFSLKFGPIISSDKLWATPSSDDVVVEPLGSTESVLAPDWLGLHPFAMGTHSNCQVQVVVRIAIEGAS